MVVTHDARLIEATECRLWIVDDQEVTPWEGGMSFDFLFLKKHPTSNCVFISRTADGLQRAVLIDWLNSHITGCQKCSR